MDHAGRSITDGTNLPFSAVMALSCNVAVFPDGETPIAVSLLKTDDW